MGPRITYVVGLLLSSGVAASDVSISWEILDKDGVPVPAAEAYLVAYSPEGKELGPSHKWRIGSRANSEGKGLGGFSSWTPPEGWGRLEVEHPAVGRVKSRKLEWAEIERRQGNKTPHIVLRATNGPGLAKWKKDCQASAEATVARVGSLKGKSKEELARFVDEVGEFAYAPLLRVLEDHKDPGRERYVWALLTAHSRCLAPVNPELVRRTEPVLRVARFRQLIRMKPRSSHRHVADLGETVIPELSWAVSVETTPSWKQRLQSVLEEVRSNSRSPKR